MKIISLATIIFLVPAVACCMQTEQSETTIYFVKFATGLRDGARTDGQLPTHVHTLKKVDEPTTVQKAKLHITMMKKESANSANIILNFANDSGDYTPHATIPYSQLRPLSTTEPFNTITANKENNAFIIYLDHENGIIEAITGQQIIDWDLPRAQQFGCIEFDQTTRNKAISLLQPKIKIIEKAAASNHPVEKFTSQSAQQTRFSRIIRNIGRLLGIGVLLLTAGYVCVASVRLLLYQK